MLNIAAANFKGYYSPYPLSVENLIKAAEEAARERVGLLVENNHDIADWLEREQFAALLDPARRDEAAAEIVGEYI